MKAKITADEIYSRLEDFEAAARALHHEDYAIMRDFWIGGHNALRHIHKHQRETDQHWRERRKRLVGANYTRPIIDKIARVEYGGHVVRRLGDPELQARWDAAAAANKVGTFQLRTARQRGIDGCCIVQLYWDEAAGRVRWQHVLPEHFLPVVLPGDNYDEISAVIIDRQLAADQTAPRHRVREDEPSPPSGARATRRVEIYTPEEVGVWIDGRKVEGKALRWWERQAQYGCLPFVIFNGPLLVGDVLGYSLARGIVEINHFINRHLSNLSEIIDYQAFSLLVVKMGLSGMPLDADGRPLVDVGADKFLMVGEGGDAHFISPQPKISEILDVLDRMIGVMYETGSVPVAAVQPQQSHAESGVSRQIQFMPLRDLVKELQTQDIESERELVAKTLLLEAVHRGERRSYEDALERTADLQVVYPETYHPVDEASRVELYMARREARLESRRMQLRREHPELSDEAIAALEAQIDDDLRREAEAAVFPPSD